MSCSRNIVSLGFKMSCLFYHLLLYRWSLIRSRYYWKGTYEDVQQFVKSCDVCQRKGPLKKAKKPLQSIPVPASPFQQIGMDLIGPLKTTNNGKNAYYKEENSKHLPCVCLLKCFLVKF